MLWTFPKSRYSGERAVTAALTSGKCSKVLFSAIETFLSFRKFQFEMDVLVAISGAKHPLRVIMIPVAFKQQSIFLSGKFLFLQLTSRHKFNSDNSIFTIFIVDYTGKILLLKGYSRCFCHDFLRFAKAQDLWLLFGRA